MAPKYRLTYFNTEGMGEQIRYILSYGGAEYEDVRFEKEDWPKLKPTMPLGKVPILEVDGKLVHQSGAICRYLAREFGINGKDEMEALEIDVAVDSMWDFVLNLAVLFNDPDEESKAKKKEKLINETMPFYLPKFEEMIKNNGGYFVGGKLSRADLTWVAMRETFQRHMNLEITDGYPLLKAHQDKILALPAIKACIARRPKAS